MVNIEYWMSFTGLTYFNAATYNIPPQLFKSKSPTGWQMLRKHGRNRPTKHFVITSITRVTDVENRKPTEYLYTLWIHIGAEMHRKYDFLLSLPRPTRYSVIKIYEIIITSAYIFSTAHKTKTVNYNARIQYKVIKFYRLSYVFVNYIHYSFLYNSAGEILCQDFWKQFFLCCFCFLTRIMVIAYEEICTSVQEIVSPTYG